MWGSRSVYSENKMMAIIYYCKKKICDLTLNFRVDKICFPSLMRPFSLARLQHVRVPGKGPVNTQFRARVLRCSSRGRQKHGPQALSQRGEQGGPSRRVTLTLMRRQR